MPPEKSIASDESANTRHHLEVRSLWFLLAILALGAFCLFWKYAIPGFAVIGMAIVAALMSIDPKMSSVRKICWLLLLGIFAALEVRAISKDRDSQTKNFSQTLSAITGGESYAFLSLKPQTPAGAEIGEIVPFLVQRGSSPIRDMKMSLLVNDIDQYPYGKIQRLPARDVAVGERTFLFEHSIKIDAKEKMNFTIYYDALNGHWTQRISLRNIGGTWSQATQVVRSGQNTKEMPIIYEYVDSNFPKISGKPNWGN